MALAESDIAAHEPFEGIRHNCAVAAFYFDTPAPMSTLIPALAAQNHRGEEGVGVVGFLPDGTISAYRNKGIVRDNADAISNADADVNIALGHDRYSTSGGPDAWQPFCDEGDRVATAHNGNITNPLSFLDELDEDERAILSSDTHVLHKALNAKPEQTIEERLQSVLPRAEGAYSLTIADRETGALYLIRDPWGFRPLHYAPLRDGNGFVAASETMAFVQYVDDSETIVEVKRGQCLRIDQNGITEIPIDFPEVPAKTCIFEHVYLQSPGSEFDGIRVDKFREECGKALANRDISDGFIPDVIVPIPSSGTTSARGYSAAIMRHLMQEGYTADEIDKMDLQPREGFLRNHYVRRTFILPDGRSDAVAEKFTVVERIVKGKKIVLVDDSVVRGTTMTKLVKMCRDAGALEVHIRSASPTIKHGCFYGVDFTGENEELIAEGRTEADIAAILGADSIAYIDTQEMVGIGSRLGGRENGFCTACFDGNYPVPVNPDLLLGKSC